ncbi:MAG: N-6 DNA methylase [Lachnoclostridium sp.]|nr:N-6 DNA methylase [Lachnoclostridium sp.]
MAKKQKTFSHVGATEALHQLAERGTTGAEFIYELLRIFAGYGDGQVRRTKEGPGNAAKDGKTILVKGLVAYRDTTGLTDTGMYDTLEEMRADAKIAKCSPRLYITSDGIDVIAYDPKENDFYENRIDLMWRDFEFFTPLAGIEKIQYAEEAEADVKSAELMAKLFDEIRRNNIIDDEASVHALNVFMSRLLFCFFAEDTGLFPGQNLFTNTLSTHTNADGSDLAEFIDRAFLAMSTRDEAVLATLPDLYSVFPYVNGGLFKERFPIPKMSRRARTLIINCGEYDWRDINPDIFGSMIQAVITPAQRAGLGMHYTSVPNIEKVIRPLFLDSLIEEYTAACDEAKEKMAKKQNPARATQRLRNLLNRLSHIKFFDPACGSGNFLIITYKRLRELEIMIWQAMRDIANDAMLPFPSITLTQFYGIELDPFAADTATLSMWLAEHQMNVKFGQAFGVRPDTLPLKASGQIVCGNACRLDWNTVCPHTPDEEVYIMGNPPYLGSKLQDNAQKEDMQIALKDVKDKKGVDYIAAWFWKGAKYIKDTSAKYAFVTTNSISQGEQVAMLWKPIFSLGLEIFFAHTSFKWSNNAKYNATVTVAIIGVQNASKEQKILYIEELSTSSKVDNISPYLVASDNLIVAKNYSIPNGLPKAVFGCMPYDNGHLIFSEEEKAKLIEEYPKSEKYIKQLMGSQEFLKDIHRYCLWIDDRDREDADSIPPIGSRIAATAYFREYESKDGAALVDRPHQFREHYEINSESKDKIIIPRVSSERRPYIPIGYVNRDMIISDSAFAIYEAEMWLFALLTSKMHNLWVRAVGGSLETRIRYSATLCYNTFPFPKLTTADKEELSNLAQTILDIRDENCDMTLGEMYNPETMPEELREAHHALDLAVERIYRAEPFTSDEERLEHLFRLYAKMTKTK